MATDTLPNPADILSRAIDRDGDGLSKEVARFLLSLKLADVDVRRLNELAARARAGALTPAEQQALDEYRRCGRLVEILQLKARLAMEQAS
ncbi:MAG: hypothetical protein HYS13_22220 [Planctomycetia bacterium]|nr:hypothetical protein [Planctomycetia bacterium]